MEGGLDSSNIEEEYDDFLDDDFNEDYVLAYLNEELAKGGNDEDI